jgi:hypothetical protein
MVAGLRRSSHFAANRIENLGFTQAGNHQTEEMPVIYARSADERSRSGASLNQAFVLQVAQGASHGRARGLILIDQLQFGGQTLAFGILAGCNGAAQLQPDLFVLRLRNNMSL